MSSTDTTGWICPNHPFSHTWNHGLRCSGCGATRTPGDAVLSLLESLRYMPSWKAADLAIQVRAEGARDGAALAERIAAELFERDPESQQGQGH